MLEVVCLNVGDQFPDLYVERLFNMLSRQVDEPFQLTCFTDRNRDLPSAIKQSDCSSWGYSGWFNKVKLFDIDEMPSSEFLYFDVSLVIRSNLRRLIDFAAKEPADLIAVRDWHYDVLNSCVMRITRSETSQTIWQAYRENEFADEKFPGDQNFIDAVIKRKGLTSQLQFFPSDFILSYKSLLKLHRRKPQEAAEMLKGGMILKFHGRPRMPDLLSPRAFLKSVTRRYPNWAFKDWMYLSDEVREHWR